jgi:membrane-associated phospholipid phosphatase
VTGGRHVSATRGVGRHHSVPIVVALVVAVATSVALFAVFGRFHVHGADIGDAVARHSWLRRFLLARRDPSQETGLLLTLAVAAIAVGIIVVGSLLEMVNKRSGFAKWDDSAARFGARHATEDTTTALKTVTTLGATWFAIAIVAVVGVILFIRYRRISIVAFLATSVVTALLVNNVVKSLVDRARPDIARLVGAHGSSFPSGHSAMAAASYAALALVLGRRRQRRARVALAGAAIVIAVAVATTRVLLGVHWLTDVTAGLFVGWSCFTLCAIAFGGRVLRFGQPVESAQHTAEVVDELVDPTANHPSRPVGSTN